MAGFEPSTEAVDNSRGSLGAVEGKHLVECGQLALNYVDLAILAVCHHDGHYARRGWRGWKGDDEVRVPWCPAG
jgi:hypothetical protein